MRHELVGDRLEITGLLASAQATIGWPKRVNCLWYSKQSAAEPRCVQKTDKEMFRGWPATSSSKIRATARRLMAGRLLTELPPCLNLSDQPASAGSATIRFPLADHSRARSRCESIVAATCFRARVHEASRYNSIGFIRIGSRIRVMLTTDINPSIQ